ncbi:MAG: hypothetical protein AB7P08_04555 [Burkholderiales bacterium]
MRHAALALALACGAAAPAMAACAWEWLCNGEGTCRRMPVCDSVHETPPPRTGSLPPAPLAMRPLRLAGSARGELSCEHVLRLARDGRWTWREACYCADKSRNPDAARPFAHIVRCERPDGR